MSVGDAIFYSALFLGIVGLFAATKDRWKWTRIAKWGVAIPVGAASTLALGLWLYSLYEGLPRAQDEFGGVKLVSAPTDVRFLKGEPVAKHSDAERWVYYAQSGTTEPSDAVYIVQFRDGTVRHITYWATERQSVHPYLHAFTIGADYADVTKKLGAPDNVSTSEDGLRRALSYSKLRTFFEFEKAKVRALGIFDATRGPVKFTKEASPPASEAK